MPRITRFSTMMPLAAGLALVLTTAATAAAPLQGSAQVIDGNVLEVDGRLVRLRGIDAPEANQRCDLPDGTKWFCGRSAALVLTLIIGQQAVTCDAMENGAAAGTDGVGCRAGTTDIGAEMIRRGMAWAATGAPPGYEALEKQSQSAGIGVFQAPTEPPSALRERRMREARGEAPGDCVIKGNVDTLGRRIYHMPWSQWYALTQITPGRGERWFCSESEAVAAGWRRAAWDFVPRLDPDDMPKGGVLVNQR